ncbi:type II toxin-antitoxin system PemK/MazF family toxin [Castellaniella sp. GW247-6E4]|uniref:type II toxin-antitoxin system PemK/MazF family toxin n=1 Tax=Castellaniella sp. GW247-6E4 TaxID=3140380 RepID=UPI0033156730
MAPRTAGPRAFVPDIGDVVHVHFAAAPMGAPAAPKAALILSPAAYNRKTGLMVCCALTRQPNGYPFETLLEVQPGAAVLADQVKSLKWAGTHITLEGRATPDELAQVRAKLRALLFHD